MINQKTDRHILSVSQLNQQAKHLLESQLPLLWVQGEISNFSRPSSGHWYLTLKDNNAQIRCAMFRSRNQHVRFTPKHGDQVVVRGRVSLYEQRGDYQFIAEQMEAEGAGLLQQQFEALKQKLNNEGLFEAKNKQALPAFPHTIGVITSPTGAVIRDILSVSRRRYPWVNIVVYPTPVQGKEAIREIAKAINRANNHNEADLLIVARGGGSLEDLWAFNEETVARAIANSALPIISAVGHETDTTIADFVADQRAPTPSAAAEMAGPDGALLQQQVLRSQRQLEQSIQRQLEQKQRQLQHLGKRLRSPEARLREQSQHLDHLDIRLNQAWQHGIDQQTATVNQWQNRLLAAHPSKQLSQLRQQQQNLQQRLQRAMTSQLRQHQQQLGQLATTLNAVSPLNTLERGYSIVRQQEGSVVSSSQQLQINDTIDLLFKDGQAQCVVEKLLVASDAANQPPKGNA